MQRLAVLTTVVTLVLAGAATASAQQGDIQIPIDTVVRGVPDGEVVQLTSVPVAAELVGSVCTGDATGRNNTGSVHPGNDLLVATGTTSEVLVDVEREPGAVTSISGQLVLGTDITVSLRMGPDGTFSGGIDVILDCSPPPTTTTTTPPTTVPPTTTPPTTVPPTTVPPTTTPPSTTTTVPPLGSTTVPPTTAPEATTTTVPPLGSTTVPPAPQLPATGSAVDAWVVVLGAGLVAAGSGAVVWERRRRHSA